MLRSFRLVCDPTQIPLVEALLRAEGFAFNQEPFSPWCRILTHEPLPLGSSLAAFFGLVYIQDRSSMLPPLALWKGQQAPNANTAVLDMCASPGSKTGFLAQLVGKEGFVLGNEPAKPRLATLRANMQNLSFLHVATCSYAGEQLPLLPDTWDFIQLDPPCSGWGTVEKNPKVLSLWQGDKVKPLIVIQQKLLRKAWELLRPGGEVVYSTCTTNIMENEEQVRFALEELGFELVPLTPFEGFVWEEPLPTSEGKYLAEGTLRVDGEASQAQGFYIAKFRKPAAALSSNAPHTPFFTPAQDLHKDMLGAPCTDITLLPQGKIALFGDTARFIPKAALQILPENIQWQAAALGKFAGDAIRLYPRCRTLMPSSYMAAQDTGLILENVADIRALLQGQSRQTSLAGRETGLYFEHQGEILPLGRITLKKGRALWSGK